MSSLNVDVALPIDEPGWLALRIKSDEKTELGGPLFGHTSAVYVEMAGKTIFRRGVAETLVAEMQEAMELTLDLEQRFAVAHADAMLATGDRRLRTFFEQLARQDRAHASLLSRAR